MESMSCPFEIHFTVSYKLKIKPLSVCVGTYVFHQFIVRPIVGTSRYLMSPLNIGRYNMSKRIVSVRNQINNGLVGTYFNRDVQL